MDKRSFITNEGDAGQRLDRALVSHYQDVSREYFKKLILDGSVFVNGKKVKSSYKIKIGDKIEIDFPEVKELNLKAKDIPLDILFEDDDIIVVNKPAGMVVHPGMGDVHMEDSLVNAILFHCKGSLSGIGGVMRPGIVHRLDKNTSGILVVAKNDKSHRSLADQFKTRVVGKVYLALVAGRLIHKKGKIESPIGRDPQDRKKMAVTNEKKGKMAITKYEVLDYLGNYSFVRVTILTGRMHQIRVHFASIDHPVVGDDVYGKRKANKMLKDEFGIERQFLHAAWISFEHPTIGKKLEFKSELPKDLQKCLEYLKKENVK